MVSIDHKIIAVLRINMLRLINTLATEEAFNEMWCTYGTCPNCSYLIDRDGIIHTTQDWFDAGEMERAITDLVTVK